MSVSAKFAIAAQIAASTAALALLLLHLLRPELAPGAHMISEYAIGPYGWLMTLSFVGFACANWALLVAAAPRLRGVVGRAALLFFVLAGIGAALGGIFPIDPTTSDPEKMSFSGHMHGLGFMIGVPSQLFAVVLVAVAARKVDVWSKAKLGVLAALVWASLAGMIPLLMAGHDFGWPNRAFMLFYAAFVFAVARPLGRHVGVSAG